MRDPRRLLPPLLVVSLVLAACGSATLPTTPAPSPGSDASSPIAPGSPAGPDRTPAGASADPIVFFRDGGVTDEALDRLLRDGAVDVAVVAAFQTALEDLPPADQTSVLQSLAARYELESARVSGLVDALGGEASGVRAIAGAWAPIQTTVTTLDPSSLNLQGVTPGDEPVAGHGSLLARLASYRRSTPAAPVPLEAGDASAVAVGAVGAMLGSMALSAMADPIVSRANGFTSADTVTTGEDAKAGMKITDSIAKSTASMDYDGKEGDVDVKFHVEMTVEPCPDPNGRFSLSATLDVSTAKGTTGARTTIEMKILGQVNDDARLAGTNTETRMQTSAFGGGEKGQYVDFTLSSGTGRELGLTMNRAGGAVSSALVQLGTLIALMYEKFVGEKLVAAAEKAWSSGRCVRLDPTADPGPRNVKPGSTSTILAPPRSRIDGAAVGGSVVATLTAGGANVDPSATKLPADASFTYTAPTETGKSGTVALEARSKRGVGKATLEFTTAAAGYTAKGGGGGVTITGTIPDLGLPFTLNGTGDGFTIKLTYVPTDGTGRTGTMTYKGSGRGFTLSGTSTYKVTGDEGGPLVLTQTGEGCVNTSCATGTEVLELTPLQK